MSRNLLIVGAGFSANAGLPVASGFTKELLSTASTGPSRSQAALIRHFVHRAFGVPAHSSTTDWPDLEDVLTTVDLAANSGHHLGRDFSAADLRVVRRAVIVRMIRMLEQRYDERRKAPDATWHVLEDLLSRLDLDETSILSMNWDTVVERGIQRTQGVERVDYGIDAVGVRFSSGEVMRRSTIVGKELSLLKPHGSVNWLYCDACRTTYWLPPEQFGEVAKTLFRTSDWEAVNRFHPVSGPAPMVASPACPVCESTALGTRFATFSYRKALDFPMHSASWRAAERRLREAENWIFVGYSMPSADFEFKFLLKRVELSRRPPPTITVVAGGDAHVARSTIDRYRRFFGERPGGWHAHTAGLDGAAIAHLEALGAIRSA